MSWIQSALLSFILPSPIAVSVANLGITNSIWAFSGLYGIGHAVYANKAERDADKGRTNSAPTLPMPVNERSGRMNLFNTAKGAKVKLFDALRRLGQLRPNDRCMGVHLDEGKRPDGTQRTTLRDFLNLAAREELELTMSAEDEPEISYVSSAYRSLMALSEPTRGTERVSTILANQLPGITEALDAIGSASQRQRDLAITFGAIAANPMSYDYIQLSLVEAEINDLMKLEHNQEVVVCAYDICNGWLSETAGTDDEIIHPETGAALKNIWHVSICAFGYEYATDNVKGSRRIKRIGPARAHVTNCVEQAAKFEQGSVDASTGVTTHGRGTIFKSWKLGLPHVSKHTFDAYVMQLAADRFPDGSYDLIDNNCVDFANDALWFLCRGVLDVGIREQINTLKYQMTGTSAAYRVVRHIRDILNMTSFWRGIYLKNELVNYGTKALQAKVNAHGTVCKTNFRRIVASIQDFAPEVCRLMSAAVDKASRTRLAITSDPHRPTVTESNVVLRRLHRAASSAVVAPDAYRAKRKAALIAGGDSSQPEADAKRHAAAEPEEPIVDESAAASSSSSMSDINQ